MRRGAILAYKDMSNDVRFWVADFSATWAIAWIEKKNKRIENKGQHSLVTYFFQRSKERHYKELPFTSHRPLDKLQMTKLHQSRRFAYHITIEVSEEDQRKTKLTNSSMGFSCKQSTLGRTCVDHFFLERAAASPPASNPTAVTAMPMPIIPSTIRQSRIISDFYTWNKLGA